MKRIAYIRSSNIYDDSRATKEICALLDKDYSVCVFGWNRDGNALKKAAEVFSKYGEKVQLNFFNYNISNGIGIKNIHVLLKWIKWVKQGIKKIKDLNCIHACNLDSALGYYNYCQRRKIKIIYDIYDYYVDSHNIPNILKRFIERLEIITINRANVTIICTEERKQQIAKAKPKKLIIIHNSPDVEKIKLTKLEYDYVYCGMLGEKRLLEEILNEYHNNSDLRIAVAGYGKYAEIAKELSEKYENFKFLGPLKYDDVIKIESKSMTISAIYEPTIRNHQLCAPNKFYEAMALGKPVIVCKGTGIDKIVHRNDIGYVINYNSRDFYETLRKLKKDAKLCSKMGQKARKLYEEKYRWSIMREKLLKMYGEELK